MRTKPQSLLFGLLSVSERNRVVSSLQAIQHPGDEGLQEKSWGAVVPLVGKLKKFYEFSMRLGKTQRPNQRTQSRRRRCRTADAALTRGVGIGDRPPALCCSQRLCRSPDVKLEPG